MGPATCNDDFVLATLMRGPEFLAVDGMLLADDPCFVDGGTLDEPFLAVVDDAITAAAFFAFTSATASA